MINLQKRRVRWNQNFWGLFFLYHASQLHLQTNKNVNLCYGLYRRKSVTFWNEGTFSLVLSVQEVQVIFKWNNLQESRQSIASLKKHEFCIPYVSLS